MFWPMLFYLRKYFLSCTGKFIWHFAWSSTSSSSEIGHLWLFTFSLSKRNFFSVQRCEVSNALYIRMGFDRTGNGQLWRYFCRSMFWERNFQEDLHFVIKSLWNYPVNVCRSIATQTQADWKGRTIMLNGPYNGAASTMEIRHIREIVPSFRHCDKRQMWLKFSCETHNQQTNCDGPNGYGQLNGDMIAQQLVSIDSEYFVATILLTMEHLPEWCTIYLFKKKSSSKDLADYSLIECRYRGVLFFTFIYGIVGNKSIFQQSYAFFRVLFV